MTQEERQPSWWQTVPGMLTGAAAVITAITGLLLAFNQAGWLRRDTTAADAPAIETAGHTGSSATKAADAAAQPSAPTVVPVVSEAMVGDITFTVLDVQTRLRNPESYTLLMKVRFHNQRSYGANFWNANFRLLVDGVPRAPTGDLNQVVDGHSALDGDVEFTVPVNATSLALELRVGDEATEIGLRQ